MTLQTASIRTFELVVNVTGYLEGKLEDWPAMIQDKIYEAMERKADEVKLPLCVADSGCGYDEDEGYFLHVILSEVIAGDERTINKDNPGPAVHLPKLLH